MAKSNVKVLIAAAICLVFWTIALDLLEIASSWNLRWLRIVLILLTILYTIFGFYSEWSNRRRSHTPRPANPVP